MGGDAGASVCGWWGWLFLQEALGGGIGAVHQGETLFSPPVELFPQDPVLCTCAAFQGS